MNAKQRRKHLKQGLADALAALNESELDEVLKTVLKENLELLVVNERLRNENDMLRAQVMQSLL